MGLKCLASESLGNAASDVSPNAEAARETRQLGDGEAKQLSENVADVLCVRFDSLDYAEIAQELKPLSAQEQVRPIAHAILLNTESQRTVWGQGKTGNLLSAFV